MFDQQLRDQVIEWVSRIFPEWIELAEEHLDDWLKSGSQGEGIFSYNSPERMFAGFITQAYAREKGLRFDSVEQKKKEISDFLGAVKASDLADEEIRWQLDEKLGGIE